MFELSEPNNTQRRRIKSELQLVALDLAQLIDKKEKIFIKDLWDTWYPNMDEKFSAPTTFTPSPHSTSSWNSMSTQFNQVRICFIKLLIKPSG